MDWLVFVLLLLVDVIDVSIEALASVAVAVATRVLRWGKTDAKMPKSGPKTSGRVSP